MIQTVVFEGRDAVAFWLRYFVEEILFKCNKKRLERDRVYRGLTQVLHKIHNKKPKTLYKHLDDFIGNDAFIFGQTAVPNLGARNSELVMEIDSETRTGHFLMWNGQSVDNRNFLEIRFLVHPRTADVYGVQLLYSLGKNRAKNFRLKEALDPAKWRGIHAGWDLISR